MTSTTSVIGAPVPENPARRQFIRLGLMTSATVGGAALLPGCASQSIVERSAADPVTILTDEQKQLFAALAPVILDRESVDNESLIPALDEAVASLGDVNRAEFDTLLSLLTFAPTRALAAGVWSDWPEASTKDKQEFLDGWRNSSLGLLNAGYIGLTKLTSSVYYGLPENRAASGYPGPPAYAIEALPQFKEALA